MVKVVHRVDEFGNVVRVTKTKDKEVREFVTEEDMDKYEFGRNLFGAIGTIVVFIFIVKFMFL